MATPILELHGLTKVFRDPWLRRRHVAVDGLSLSIDAGEIFGLIGPNGAGKTTTFKMLLGLVPPTAGHVRLRGQALLHPEQRHGIGFLPEQPYFYDHLSVRETLDFYARLCGLGRPERRRRIDDLAVTFGLQDVLARPLRTLSKGNLQRVGMAQALLASPPVVILDEPMSGLDPIGRKQIRDIIQTLRAEGHTVVFSSHILSDAQLLCDRVAILGRGRLRELVRLSELTTDAAGYEVVITDVDDGALRRLQSLGLRQLEQQGTRWICTAGTREQMRSLVRAVALAGGTVESLTPRPVDLEQIFMRRVREAAQERQPA
jgi:ABC-2 type transport system ATP-binding protein